ncbi:MAG: SemiSWEET transporter [Saprospiraceae bacterium]|nr:SemiSWEET transporter [Bacteroidia bacterium]NNE14678.1 SemiSWEET transporter [Saprospiraceae bacterium]NNL93911.1 SemiSWEET transporter [Saprospiraceae bacterium]
MENVTIIGLCAAAFTTISFLPQAIKVIKTKHTKDISLLMYIFFTLGVVLWLIYGYCINDFPIIIANSITLSLASIILFMKMKYK